MPSDLGGRPSLLDSEVQKKLIGFIEAGNFLDVAAALSGVDRVTVYRWVKRGNREIRRCRKKHQKNPARVEKPFVEFARAYEAARAHAEARNVSNINLVARGMPAREITRERDLPDGTHEKTVEKFGAVPAQWTASAWYLERTNRERWGRPMRPTVQEDVPPAGEAGRPLIIRERDE